MAKRGRKAKAQRAAAPARARSQPAAEAGDAAATGAAVASTGEADARAAHSSAIAPVAAARALGNALIAAFLLFQIAMPLRYYLGGRGYDERFSWRMFSSVRMQRCEVRVDDVVSGGRDRRVDLDRELQVAWIGMLERYRVQVVDEFLHRRCGQTDVRAAHFERTCKDTDGSELPRLQVTLDCKTKQFRREEGVP